MPIIYLSPSSQEFNPYVNGGNEELYMNLIADAMEPYLYASGIKFVRNDRNKPASAFIKESNSGKYDLHLALHSNATGKTESKKRGTEVYYYPKSSKGQKAADIIANNLKLIYPLPDKVITVPTLSIGEVTKTKAPAVLIEYAYHDNSEDADWIKNNIQSIALNTSLSVADFLDVDFIIPK